MFSSVKVYIEKKHTRYAKTDDNEFCAKNLIRNFNLSKPSGTKSRQSQQTKLQKKKLDPPEPYRSRMKKKNRKPDMENYLNALKLFTTFRARNFI